ncbi:hypothetical protein OH768_52835 [Streptomyces sp. NBC_01622]|nr:hypothetical protein OH768_52835 [Streptomyces sp. NBC_01622]
MRRAALFFFYYLVLTPVGLLCRAVRDPLHRGIRPRASSYLIRR